MKPARRTILYSLNSASQGGANRSLAVLLAGLNRRRFRPLAVLPKEGPMLERLADLDVPAWIMPLCSMARIRTRAGGRLKAAVRNTLNLARLGRLLERESVDLVHSNTIFPLGGALAAALAPLPHIWHLREGIDAPTYDLRFGRPLARQAFAALADRLICISQYVRQTSVPHRARQRSVVIYNAVEKLPPPCPYELHSAPLVACVGLIGTKKRTRLFVEAAVSIARQVPTCRFTVAGRPVAGEEEVLEDCRDRVREAGLSDRFHWPGFISDPEPLYRRSDLLVHPGVNEGFGRVLVEAMSHGTPVVSVRSGAIPEIVNDGVNGLLVAPDDVEALARAAVDCLTQPSLHPRLA
ncbi:MAG: glycosyltransferase, partial [Acidobacteriota bacterium]